MRKFCIFLNVFHLQNGSFFYSLFQMPFHYEVCDLILQRIKIGTVDAQLLSLSKAYNLKI